MHAIMSLSIPGIFTRMLLPEIKRVQCPEAHMQARKHTHTHTHTQQTYPDAAICKRSMSQSLPVSISVAAEISSLS